MEDAVVVYLPLAVKGTQLRLELFLLFLGSLPLVSIVGLHNLLLDLVLLVLLVFLILFDFFLVLFDMNLDISLPQNFVVLVFLELALSLFTALSGLLFVLL